MRGNALQMNPLSPLLEQELATRFQVHRWFEIADREAFLRGPGQSVRAVVTGGHIGLPRELMDRLPALNIIAINGVGYDRIDIAEARRRGLRVSRTPGVLTEDVADLAVGLVIALLRRIPQADRHVREGRWALGDPPLARKVSGSQFGIVGLGQIGRAIADRLAAFGPVAWSGPNARPTPYRHVPGLLELAQWSDVLVLAASSNPATRGLIDDLVLDALGPTGVLINVSRGALVDEVALQSALRAGRIAGAALDVFADEPNVPEGLRTADNVVLTPHIASATLETRAAMAHAVLANLDAYFDGRPLPGAVV
jgi:lactate dehydrogenase-like 2-hydroxyacid dehydrogenase